MTKVTWYISDGTATLYFDSTDQYIDCSTTILRQLEEALISIGVTFETGEEAISIDGGEERSEITILSIGAVSKVFDLFDSMGTLCSSEPQPSFVDIDLKHVIAGRQEIISRGIEVLLKKCTPDDINPKNYRLRLTLEKK